MERKKYFTPNESDPIMTIRVNENSVIRINQRYMLEYMSKGEYKHFWAVIGRSIRSEHKKLKLKEKEEKKAIKRQGNKYG